MKINSGHHEGISRVYCKLSGWGVIGLSVLERITISEYHNIYYETFSELLTLCAMNPSPAPQSTNDTNLDVSWMLW